MNYGLHLSASGVLTNLYRQDVYANNLANASTVGFKRDIAAITQRPAEALEDNHPFAYHNSLLDKLGGGVFAGPQHISFEQGALERTGNPLDVALEDKDTFLVVSRPNPKTGEAEIRFTRDGRLARSPEGYLVTAAGGFQVLDENDGPITLDDQQPVLIDRDAGVQQGGAEVARLQVVAAVNRGLLVKEGHNLFRHTGNGDGRAAAENTRVHSGFVEASTVDPIRELLGLMQSSSAIQYNSNLIKYHDLLMDRAVNSLGRVVA